MAKKLKEKEIDPKTRTKASRKLGLLRQMAREVNPMGYSLDALGTPKALGDWRDASEEPISPAYPYQKAAIQCEDQFQIWLWSRQTGKSRSMANKICKRALKTRRNQIVLSASQFQADELMEKIRAFLEAFEELAMAIVGEKAYRVKYRGHRFTKRIFYLANGARIISLPANPRTARGFTGDIYLDEFALHRWDRKIWASIYATVTRSGGMVTVASTPMGTQNMFYELCQNPAYKVFKVTIYDAVKDGYPADPEKLKAGLGDEELWQQEYLVAFLDEATAYLTHEMISACERGDLSMVWIADAVFAGELYVGIDIGRKHDLTAVWICELLGGVLWVRGIVVMVNTPFAEQERRIEQILRHPKVRRCCMDSTGLGMQLAETMKKKFAAKVEPVSFTMAVKEDLAGKLRVRVEDQAIRIPKDPTIRNHWHAIKKIVTKSGNIRFEADRGPGGHADHFWGAALCCEAAGSKAKRPGCWTPRRMKKAA